MYEKDKKQFIKKITRKISRIPFFKLSAEDEQKIIDLNDYLINEIYQCVISDSATDMSGNLKKVRKALDAVFVDSTPLKVFFKISPDVDTSDGKEFSTTKLIIIYKSLFTPQFDSRDAEDFLQQHALIDEMANSILRLIPEKNKRQYTRESVIEAIKCKFTDETMNKLRVIYAANFFDDGKVESFQYNCKQRFYLAQQCFISQFHPNQSMRNREIIEGLEPNQKEYAQSIEVYSRFIKGQKHSEPAERFVEDLAPFVDKKDKENFIEHIKKYISKTSLCDHVESDEQKIVALEDHIIGEIYYLTMEDLDAAFTKKNLEKLRKKVNDIFDIEKVKTIFAPDKINTAFGVDPLKKFLQFLSEEEQEKQEEQLSGINLITILKSLFTTQFEYRDAKGAREILAPEIVASELCSQLGVFCTKEIMNEQIERMLNAVGVTDRLREIYTDFLGYRSVNAFRAYCVEMFRLAKQSIVYSVNHGHNRKPGEEWNPEPHEYKKCLLACFAIMQIDAESPSGQLSAAMPENEGAQQVPS